MKNIGKEIFVSKDGKRVGYVLDVAVDFQTFNKTGYIVVDEEDETEFAVGLEDIETIGDCILIKDETCLKYLEEKHDGLIGKKVLDVGGQDFGCVKEIEFERNKCKRLATEKCEIETKFIKLVGNGAILVSFKKRQRRKTFSKKEVFDLKDNKFLNMPKIVAPEKISLAFNFYSGKVAKEDVFGYNNERIVTKGGVVSRALFENVKKHNKLNELFFAIQ